MSEIKVVPYIPDEDYDNPAMVVDFYEFTMANCLFLNGFKDTTLVFDMFFRKNPDNQGYSISAGQRKLTRFLLNYHFNAQDIWWLRTKGMSEEFCEYLRTYQWKGDMYALPEGTVRRRYSIEGQVQGVGFRYRARYAAQSLELTGWVENEDDGSVTLEVQGDPVKFRKLFALIQRSDYIQITAIRQKDIAPDPWERGFSVRGY